ncbi:hypothetical protein D3C87_705090 [compost metagenome]
MSQEKTIEQYQVELMEALQQDEALKAEFLASPNEVASRVLGIQIPSFIKLMPVEVPANAILIPLPARMDEDELSDLDLEMVAGGKTQVGKIIKMYGLALGAGIVTLFGGANSKQLLNQAGAAYNDVAANTKIPAGLSALLK